MRALCLCVLLDMRADVEGRCFLYLVNYARMKPEVALRALPILLRVRYCAE